MATANRMQQQELIVVKIDQVDLANRQAHVTDKTDSPFIVSFRSTPGGIFHVPAQGEKWTAKRLGATWHLDQRLDSLDEHTWAVANMGAGDTRISSAGTLHLRTDVVEINDRSFGATVTDYFYSASLGFTSVTLGGTPVSAETVQVFLNGVLVPLRIWTLSGRTLTFSTTMGAGDLTIYYQTMLHQMDDAATVVGRAIISAAEEHRLAQSFGRLPKGTISDSGYAGYKAASKYALAATADVTEIQAWVDIATSPVTARAMIYADSAGVPGALIAVSSDVVIPVGTSQNVTFLITAHLTAANYWLTIGFNGGGGGVSVWCENVGTGSHVYKADPTAANPFGAPDGTSSTAGDIDIAAIYT